MYLKEFIKQYNDKKIKLFIDMDGVIADYIFGEAKEFDKKRQLYDSIKKLETISKMDNIELYILSVTRTNIGINEKNIWLDKYVDFIKKENRIILSKEGKELPSSKLKALYLNTLKTKDTIIVIDDDPRVLKEINNLNKNIILLKDTVLVD